MTVYRISVPEVDRYNYTVTARSQREARKLLQRWLRTKALGEDLMTGAELIDAPIEEGEPDMDNTPYMRGWRIERV